MSEIIQELKKKLSFLDCSQTNVQKTSQEFINCVKEDETCMEDLVKLWKYFCSTKNDKLAYIFLANDIIQNSFFLGLKFHEVFFNHLIEVFPVLFNSLNEKLRKEIFRVFEIWEERKIYDQSKIDNLKQLLNVTTIPNQNTLENPLFHNYMKGNKIKISEKIKEYAQTLDDYQRYHEKINNFNENCDEKDKKKTMSQLNSSRGRLLSLSAETIKKQNQVYFKHNFYLQEIQKLLEKIKSIKDKNENSMK